MGIRKPDSNELAMLRRLVEKADWKTSVQDWERNLRVESMQDGGMGSFQVFSDGRISGPRRFGKEISSLSFFDVDGVEVLVSLNLDQNGDLFEVDVWKADYSPVKEFQIDK